MIEHNELEHLRAQVADHERRLAEHESVRSTAVDALGGIGQRLTHLQERVAAVAPQHPATVERQAQGVLERYAIVATRTGALEGAFHELRGVTVDLFELVRDTMTAIEKVGEMLTDLRRRMDG